MLGFLLHKAITNERRTLHNQKTPKIISVGNIHVRFNMFNLILIEELRTTENAKCGSVAGLCSPRNKKVK